MAKKFTEEEIRKLLRRYRSGQCTAEESAIIDRWYSSFENHKVTGIANNDPEKLHELKIEMFRNIANRIDHAEQTPAEPEVRKLHFNFQTLARVAAILLVGTAIGMFFYTREVAVGPDHDALAKNDGHDTEEVSTATVPGPIYLADGSVVWLKGDSRLEYPESFTGDTREVTLVGEAFFDVARDPKKRFIIHSANFTTRVLGTSFNIKAYGNEDAHEVAVVTGEVVVSVKEPSDKAMEVVLTPNQKVVYSKKENSLVQYDAADSENYNAFRESKLAFDEVPLMDIVKVLNAEYDVEISLSNDAMQNCIVTADLTNESPEVGIEILSKAVSASVTTDGRKVLLSGSGCASQNE